MWADPFPQSWLGWFDRPLPAITKKLEAAVCDVEKAAFEAIASDARIYGEIFDGKLRKADPEGWSKLMSAARAFAEKANARSPAMQPGNTLCDAYLSGRKGFDRFRSFVERIAEESGAVPGFRPTDGNRTPVKKIFRAIEKVLVAKHQPGAEPTATVTPPWTGVYDLC